MSMGYTYKLGALLAFTLHILFATSFSETSDHNGIPKSTKLSLRLIHRHSILSHYSNQKISGSSSLSLDDDIRAPAMPVEDGSLFLVNISIGDPPVPQLLAMDTGSQLIWVRCTPCDGCNNVFDPTKSSTYEKLSNNSPQCTNFAYSAHEEQESQCSYSIMYEDKSYSRGLLALEKFTFVTSTGGTVRVPDVMFGCALVTGGDIPPYWNGILGLEAPNEYYFVARTGNKFSYCIGNIRDTQYVYNQLILGDGAILQGDSTPMQMNGHYVVSLEGISVGEKQLTFNPLEFRYNVVIDSGTTQTQLRRSAYEPLVAEVKSLMDGVLKPTIVRNVENHLCYAGDLEQDLKGFPIVTLHLAEGTDIDLNVESMFQRTKDGSAFCMAIVESEQNLIGILAQQYYNVGFDLDAKRVSFQRIDCELLED